MHAPFLGLKVNRDPIFLQGKYEGKGQGLTPILETKGAGWEDGGVVALIGRIIVDWNAAAFRRKP